MYACGIQKAQGQAMNPITPERYLEPDEDKPNYTLCPVCRYMTDQCECNDYFKEEE